MPPPISTFKCHQLKYSLDVAFAAGSHSTISVVTEAFISARAAFVAAGPSWVATWLWEPTRCGWATAPWEEPPKFDGKSAYLYRINQLL